MAVIARPTSAFGLLSSFVLLHHGMEKMALRYPLSLALALALAYGIFLLLIWLWPRSNADDYVDIAACTVAAGILGIGWSRRSA